MASCKLVRVRGGVFVPPGGLAQIGRILGEPQDMIGNHPTIRQKHIRTKLNSHHLGVDLNNDALQPAPYPLGILFVVAKNFDHIANVKRKLWIWGFHKGILSHFRSPGWNRGMGGQISSIFILHQN
jgi:hypothetical protein